MRNKITDEFKTVKNKSEGLYKEKGSKFYASAIPVDNEDHVKDILEAIKKQHHSARHHCYAYIIGADKEIFRSNDDGEPSGTAGKPILNQIISHDLSNVIIVVTRYFGGKKLGTSGLINAYKTAVQNALDNAEIVKKTISDVYELTYNYEDTNTAMRLFSNDDLQQISQDFDIECTIIFSIRKTKSDQVYNEIKKNKKLRIKYLRTI